MSTMTDTDTEIEVPALHFAAGIPGFPDARQFALVWWSDEDGPFSILTSLEQNGLEFLVATPHTFFPDYAPEVDDDTAERLGLDSADDAILLVIVTVGEQPGDATANLLAPIVVNRHTREAAQIVLLEGDLPLRAPLFTS
jgi:flagellar assembly factor FliW